MISDKPDKKASKPSRSTGIFLRTLWSVFLAPWRILRRASARISRSFPEFPTELRRPAVFSLLFWSAFAVTCLAWPLVSFGGDIVFGFMPSVLAAVFLVVAWKALPWDPGSSLSRKIAAPAFLVGVFVIGFALPGASLMFYPIAFANAVFLFGFRRGIFYSGGMFAIIFVDLLRTVWIYESSQSMSAVFGNSLVVTILFVPVAVFMIGISIPIVEATRRREETESLLDELGRSHERLEAAHAELKEYAAKSRELAVSAERARMAREMHDSVGHYLTVVNVQLEAAKKLMEEDPENEAEVRVARAKSLASEALSEVRRSVRALKPLAVEETSAADALGTLARNFEDIGPDVSFVVEGEEFALSTAAELTLYRALQESLTNALKHAKATRIGVSLVFGEGRVKLVVADDGVGASGDTGDRGFGLASLGERVCENGGVFTSGNAPEGGFVVEIELPGEEA